MKAYIPITYPAKFNEDYQHQWDNACNALDNGHKFWYIHTYELVDDNKNVHQVAVLLDSPEENVHLRAMRFLHAFKAHAPFVHVGKTLFSEHATFNECMKLIFDN